MRAYFAAVFRLLLIPSILRQIARGCRSPPPPPRRILSRSSIHFRQKNIEWLLSRSVPLFPVRRLANLHGQKSADEKPGRVTLRPVNHMNDMCGHGVQRDKTNSCTCALPPVVFPLLFCYKDTSCLYFNQINRFANISARNTFLLWSIYLQFNCTI